MASSEYNTNLVTLTRHTLNDQQHVVGETTGDLTLLLTSIQLGCKFVSSLVRKAGLANVYVGGGRASATCAPAACALSRARREAGVRWVRTGRASLRVRRPTCRVR